MDTSNQNHTIETTFRIESNLIDVVNTLLMTISMVTLLILAGHLAGILIDIFEGYRKAI